MIHAYDENYLLQARHNLGLMLDVGVNHFHFSLGNFYLLFLESSLPRRFEHGEPYALAGHSGIELACEVLAEHHITIPEQGIQLHAERSAEYWTGWALAYYQWFHAWSFADINAYAPIEKILRLYSPYHEMDILKLVEVLDSWYHQFHPQTRLQSLRQQAHLSQSQLAVLSGIPLRTLQQYEQRQKNLNAGRADTVLSLSRVLHCEPLMLLEPPAIQQNVSDK